MKRSLCILLTFILATTIALSFVSCGNGGENGKEAGGDPETYTVSYVNTNLEEQHINKGEVLQKPNDPTMDNSIFAGWYTNAACTQKATFPITVNSDISLYACFYTYEEAFQKARENTIGSAVPGFEYSYTMDISASYWGLSIAGKNAGTAKYSTVGEVNYYDESVNSGPLMVDGSKYQIRRGSTLQNISLDETGKMKNFSVEQVDSSYKYDSSSLAKAVFTYSDDKIGSVSPTDKNNVYELNTAMSVSSAVSLIANYINHPIIEKILCELPETAADTNIYVSFDGDRLDSYTYEFKISVSELQFDLTYTLKFTDIGTAKNIVTKNFENVALSSSEISIIKDEANAIVNAFRKQESSGYDFNVETGVDFGVTSGEINSTFKGSAYRKLQGTTAFFHNDIQIDSDYKNSVLYGNSNIKDVHVKLTKLSNGEVHLIEKKLLADSTQIVDNFVDGDTTSFYLFDILSNSGDYSFAEKTTKDGKTIYTFGLTNSGTSTLITWLNNSLDLDPLNKATIDALVYGDFSDSSVLINSGTVSIVVENGLLEEIDVTVEGDFTTAFESTDDFGNAANAQIKLNMNIVVNDDGNEFEPFDSVKDAK